MEKMKELKLEKDVLEKAQLYLEDHFKAKYVDPYFGLKGRVQEEIKSSQDLVGLYVHLEKKMDALPFYTKRSEEDRQVYDELFNYSQEISHKLVNDPVAMKDIQALKMATTVKALAENYTREQERAIERKHSYHRGRGRGMGY